MQSMPGSVFASFGMVGIILAIVATGPPVSKLRREHAAQLSQTRVRLRFGERPRTAIIPRCDTDSARC
jgi:hypothetical protein